MILLSQELGQYSVRPSWQSVAIKFGCIWFMSIQPISSLRLTLWGVGCNPGLPRPHDPGQHRGDGPRRSAGWTSVANEGSCWLRYRTSCLSLSHFSLSPVLLPAPCLGFTIKLQFPEPARGEWMRSLVMLWVNNLVRKLKNELTEAMSWCVSITQLWSLQYC